MWGVDSGIIAQRIPAKKGHSVSLHFPISLSYLGQIETELFTKIAFFPILEFQKIYEPFSLIFIVM